MTYRRLGRAVPELPAKTGDPSADIRSEDWIRVYDRESLPEELRKLKILEVTACDSRVRYTWLGGMDDTALVVQKMADGSFECTAIYDEQRRSVVWPK